MVSTRWMKYTNDEGEEERFYPITHVRSIVCGEGDNNLFDHLTNKENPHNVTADQVGAFSNIKIDGAVTGNVNYGESGNTLTVKRRNAFVGQNSSTKTNPWYKVAEVTTSTTYDDLWITFYVSDTYATYTTGILQCHVRVDGSIKIQTGDGNTSLRWLVNDGYTTSDFVLAYKNNSDSTATVQLWTKVAYGWCGRKFIVLSESGRGNAERSGLWTLYTTYGAGSQASIPSDYTQITSTSRLSYNNAVTSGTAALTAGTSALATGCIYLQYE